jgi:hypothetical protein
MWYVRCQRRLKAEKKSRKRARKTGFVNFFQGYVKEKLTDNHNGKLDTLFDLVSPASAGERHSDEMWC